MQCHPYLLLSLFLTAAIAGCTSSKQYSEALAVEQRAAGAPGGEADRSERKILFSAFLFLIVENPDSANQQVEKIAEKYNGYVNEIGTYQTIIRVESGQLDAAIAAIAALGKLKRKNLIGQDVTEQYLDYQIRLENAQKARDRYLELLNKAETVAEILKVEKELERLNETIDLLKGKMARIEHLDAFSTITINLQKRKKPGLLGYIGLGVYHAVKWLFVRN